MDSHINHSQHNENDLDVEKQAAHDHSTRSTPSPSSFPSSLSSNAELMEAAALLLIWSILVINEGGIRLVNTDPSVDLTAGGRPAKMVPFLGGVFEVLFGVIGTAVAAAAFVLRWHSPAITKLAMAIQTVLGYYVFIVFVFVIPAFRAADLTGPIVEGLSIGQSRFVIALGVLTSFHFCLALQGGQFVFMARLVVAATGTDFLKQKTGNQMRAIFWNANLALSGLWTLITGAVIHANVGGGKLAMPYESPPNVGRLPLMTIFTGLMMLVYGGLGMAMGAMRMAPSYYFIGSFVLFLYALLNFGIVQFGLIPGAPAWPTALHNGLVFMVVFLGPYFVQKAHVEGRQK